MMIVEGALICIVKSTDCVRGLLLEYPHPVFARAILARIAKDEMVVSIATSLICT